MLAARVRILENDIAPVLGVQATRGVNNPGSNLRLSTGIARVRDIIDAGGHVCFGTDSISFSEEEDFFQEMRLAAYLQRIPTDLEVGRLDSVETLRLAAKSGARAMRQESALGSLAPGKEADLLVLEKSRIFWPPEKFAANPPLDVVFDRARADDLRSVMVAGQLVLDEGRFTTVDEGEVLARFADAGRDRLFAITDERRRHARLVPEIEPYLFDFYREWSAVDLEPAYVYNSRTAPDRATAKPRGAS